MPIAKQREQVAVEPIDPCSACAVNAVRVLAREGSSDRMGGAKKGKVAMEWRARERDPNSMFLADHARWRSFLVRPAIELLPLHTHCHT